MTLCADCRLDRLCHTILIEAKPQDAAHRMAGVSVQMCAPCLDRLMRSRDRCNPELAEMVRECLPRAEGGSLYGVLLSDMTRDELIAAVVLTSSWTPLLTQKAKA